MDYFFERKVNYYETDRMGIVHHSNYIRYLEEARCYFLEILNIPYSKFEDEGIMIPVLNVNCSYKNHVTFNDVILIKVFIKEFNGVKMTIGYNVVDKKNNNPVLIAETKHCFTNNNLRPISLKKYNIEIFNILEKEFLIQNDKTIIPK